MKTDDLTGAMLDYWVAKAEGLEITLWGSKYILTHGGDQHNPAPWCPTENWSQGGPIIERENIDLFFEITEGVCEATVRSIYSNGCYENDSGRGLGRSPLIAAMRAYVTSKFGTDVDDINTGEKS